MVSRRPREQTSCPTKAFRRSVARARPRPEARLGPRDAFSRPTIALGGLRMRVVRPASRSGGRRSRFSRREIRMTSRRNAWGRLGKRFVRRRIVFVGLRRSPASLAPSQAPQPIDPFRVDFGWGRAEGLLEGALARGVRGPILAPRSVKGPERPAFVEPLAEIARHRVVKVSA